MDNKTSVIIRMGASNNDVTFSQGIMSFKLDLKDSADSVTRQVRATVHNARNCNKRNRVFNMGRAIRDYVKVYNAAHSAA